MIRKLIEYQSKLYLKVCRLNQKGKDESLCAHPGCIREWKDTFDGVKLCVEHHPSYDKPLFQRVLDDL